jgi:hypothetical protein
VPTPDTAEAFSKLAAARSRLNDVTKLLNECYANFLRYGQAARERYAALQSDWDEAFSAFEKATDEFAATVQKLHEDVEAHRLPKTE